MGGLRIASVGCLFACVASADPYDFRISDLGNPFAAAPNCERRPNDYARCPVPSGGFSQGAYNYDPAANGNFRAFARQLGAALTSVNLSPPETLGHSGFAINAELSIVDFGNPAVPLPTEQPFRGPMLIPSVHIRKGLPFSFELGARGAWIEKSRMGAGTLELKWAVNEGFTYLPDIAVRGNITKLLNSRNFDVTAGGLDVGVGKQFAIGGMVTITPYAGWNLIFVGASTGNVDFHPNRPLAESDAPASTSGVPAPGTRDVWVFESLQAISNSHNRFYGGARFIGGVVIVGAEFSYSLIGKFRDKVTALDVDVPAVMAGNFTLGLDF